MLRAVLRTSALVGTLALLVVGAPLTAEELPPIPRVLPDKGQEISAPERERVQAKLAELTTLVQQSTATSPLAADVQMFIKAVDFALRVSEFYDKKDVAKDVAKMDWALTQAKERLEKLDSHPWTTQKGQVLRGYTSVIDGSSQPYGLVIPDGLDLSKPAPLYVWLHGRNSPETDLHWLFNRSKNAGEVHPDDTIVLHDLSKKHGGLRQ